MTVADFMKKHGMDYSDIDMDSCCRIFLEEMERGLAGQESSLEMIPTYIETERDVPTEQKVVVMDAGGTNFRVAVVHFTNQKQPTIENHKTSRMPGVDEEVSKDTFFESMAKYVKDIVDKGSNIGFCFSYPTEIAPNKDGRLIRFSKEIKAKDVEGQMIGESLNIALAGLGYEGNKHIVLLNDTVATLLAGRATSSGRTYDSYVGFILGTGTNCAYIESNKNIIKPPVKLGAKYLAPRFTRGYFLDPDKSQIINIESGSFGKAPRGSIDLQFDNSTKNPGVYTFEKMISGAYFGPLCLLTIKTAAKENLFSSVATERLSSINELTTEQVNDFLCKSGTGDNPISAAVANNNNDDMVTLHDLLERLVERAAKLTAVNLSSAALKSGKGRDPNRPVCIVAEGTTFYKLKNLKSRVEYYLTEYLQGRKGRYYEIISVDNATLIGAAVAGLTN